MDHMIKLPSANMKERPFLPLYHYAIPNPKAILYVCHGMSENFSRYEALRKYFNDLNIAVIGHDHLGHGIWAKENNRLGCYYNYETSAIAMVQDLITAINWTKINYPKIPIVLLGNSMGAYICRLYLKNHSEDIAACILSATHGHVSLLKLAPILSHILTRTHSQSPNFHLHKKIFGLENIGNPVLSQMQKAWNEREKDPNLEAPLIGFVFSNSGYAMLLTLAKAATNRNWAKGIRSDLPILFMNGEKDPLIVRGYDQWLFRNELKKANMENIIFMTFRHRGHELYFYHEPDIIFKAMNTWLKYQKIF